MDVKLVTGLSVQGLNTHSVKQQPVNFTLPQEHNSSDSPLDWYGLTESSRHVLNAIIVITSRQQLLEEAKENPDLQKIAHFENQYEEAYDLLNDSENFKSLKRMREILDTCTSVLQALRQLA